ncbi:MAG: SDR family NAD(P)-dependent oxidoreductase [Bacteroidales bacterium]|nr:SDR family NAD(P)-dependent oxidoreductase [Bacteroidales bacterium]
MKLVNKSVLITGGASGIGKIMGRIALERGASHVFIWDLNQANIESTIAELKAKGLDDGTKAHGWQVDVSNAELVNETYKKVIYDYNKIDVVINCAGIITNNKVFAEQTLKDIDLTMDVNTKGAMYVSLAVLPDMIARNSGHICNIASEAGILGVPKMSVYVASKWAMIGWSDTVRLELKQIKSKVRITTIAPYFIDTGLFEGVKAGIPMIKQEPTAKKIVNAIERNKNFRGIPFGYHFSRLMQGILPTCVFDWFFGKVLGVYTCMDHFTGRTKKN